MCMAHAWRCRVVLLVLAYLPRVCLTDTQNPVLYYSSVEPFFVWLRSWGLFGINSGIHPGILASRVLTGLLYASHRHCHFDQLHLITQLVGVHPLTTRMRMTGAFCLCTHHLLHVAAACRLCLHGPAHTLPLQDVAPAVAACKTSRHPAAACVPTKRGPLPPCDWDRSRGFRSLCCLVFGCEVDRQKPGKQPQCCSAFSNMFWVWALLPLVTPTSLGGPLLLYSPVVAAVTQSCRLLP
jgi:hypothetical protein